MREETTTSTRDGYWTGHPSLEQVKRLESACHRVALPAGSSEALIAILDEEHPDPLARGRRTALPDPGEHPGAPERCMAAPSRCRTECALMLLQAISAARSGLASKPGPAAPRRLGARSPDPVAGEATLCPVPPHPRNPDQRLRTQ